MMVTIAWLQGCGQGCRKGRKEYLAQGTEEGFLEHQEIMDTVKFIIQILGIQKRDIP